MVLDITSIYNKLKNDQIVDFPSPLCFKEIEECNTLPTTMPPPTTNPATTNSISPTTNSITTTTNSITNGEMELEEEGVGGEEVGDEGGEEEEEGGDEGGEEEEEGGDEGGEEEEEEDEDVFDEYDERTDIHFRRSKKYAIGFLHLKADVPIITFSINVNKETTPDDVVQKFKENLDNPLLNQGILNMKFKPMIENDDIHTYEISNIAIGKRIRNGRPVGDHNKSYLEIDVYNERFARLLRLNSMANKLHKITIHANRDFKQSSDNFEKNNPFKDDFDKNLPLILSPKNASLLNSFVSGIGDTTSFGIIDKVGRVKGAIPTTMRPSAKERFSIDFLTTELTNKYSTRDHVLYFHFIIEPI